MNSCAVYQTGYFQPLHYYARMLSVDKFMLLTQAQLNRRVGQARASIYGKSGTCVLSVPVLGGNRISLDAAMPDYSSGWVRKHCTAIEQVYKKALMFDTWYPKIEKHLNTMEKYSATLAEIGIEQVKMIAEYVGYGGCIVKSTDKAVWMNGSMWMLHLAVSMNASEYVCGKVAYDEYLDREAFAKAGIGIVVQDWACTEYKQQGRDFIPNLSVIDLLMNCSKEEVCNILKGGNR